MDEVKQCALSSTRRGVPDPIHGLSGGQSQRQWHGDKENRRALPKNTFIPVIPEIEPDAITQEVMELVQKSLPNSFGKLDRFTYAVTRDRALELAKLFIETRLANFGA